MPDQQSLRIAALRGDIATRLRPVCKDWPEATFDEMVQQLAALTLKYEGQVSAGTYDRRVTDRLVESMKESLERSEHLRASHVEEAE